jgi:predicted homoserine dehydrogenase-like protein
MGGHHHSIDAVAPALLPGAALAEDAPVPFYLMANLTLRRDVPAGEFIRLADVELEEGSSLLALRRYQDAVFHGQASTVAAPVFD